MEDQSVAHKADLQKNEMIQIMQLFVCTNGGESSGFRFYEGLERYRIPRFFECATTSEAQRTVPLSAVLLHRIR